MAAVNPQPLQSRPYEDEGEHDEGEYDEGGDIDAMEEEEEAEANAVSPMAAGVSVLTSAAVTTRRTSELTLSFEGEVYVFPVVTPEKGVGDTLKRSNLSRRIASLVRFREKRKERCFDKKIRYTVRKEVAQRMHRKNGQFASLKENSGESGFYSAQSSVQDGIARHETLLRKCQHLELVKIILLLCAVDLRVPEHYVMLVVLCGRISLQGTLRDLSKGGRNLCIDHNESANLLEMKPSIVECEFSGNQGGHGAPEDASKLVIERSNDASVNLDVENFHASSEDLTNSYPMEIVPSSNNHNQQEGASA